jgi:hypothetical protein
MDWNDWQEIENTNSATPNYQGYQSRFSTDRSKSAMELGHFLLFSYAERLSGAFGENSPVDYADFFLGYRALAQIRYSEDFVYSELIEQVSEESSYFINGVEFDTDLLSEIYSLLNPDHILPKELCLHCLNQENFALEFNLLNVWRKGNFLGIQSPAVLREMAFHIGDLDGSFGYILSGNPYCPTDLLLELQSSNYISTKSEMLLASKVIHEPFSTKWRTDLNLKIKQRGYFLEQSL